MRSIEISTDVFSRIWAHRIAGEETEDAILRRLLSGKGSESEAIRSSAATKAGFSGLTTQRVLWRDDVRQALIDLGGQAPLDAIYAQVRGIRRAEGRKLPRHTDAIVRRELEYNSSDSESYTEKRDWFRAVHGIGAGVWGIRK